MEILECCVKNSCFQERQNFSFRIEDGLPMGSPLSPFFANIYREWFEESAIKKSPNQPKLWLRYVNDTFIFGQQGLDVFGKFSRHLNYLTPSTISGCTVTKFNKALSHQDTENRHIQDDTEASTRISRNKKGNRQDANGPG